MLTREEIEKKFSIMGNSDNNIIVIENFLDKQTTELLDNFLHLQSVESPDSYTFISKKTVEHDKNIFYILDKIEKDTILAINQEYKDYNITVGLGFKRKINFASRKENSPMAEHSDWDHIEDSSDYLPSNISALVYLNDKYVGGEIVFPEHNLTYKPVAGSLIIFPSNYKHLVLASQGSNRHSLTCFYCFL
jgi:hypothetical protein